MIGLEYISNIKGLSLTEIAEEIDLTRKSTSEWVRGRVNIPPKRLKQLSERFDIPEELIGNELTNETKIKILELEIGQLMN